MELELTPEQTNQIVRAARVLAPGLTKEQLLWLVNSQRRLADSGFCQAAWGLARLEQERNISCPNVLDAIGGLLREQAQAKAVLAQLKGKQLAQQAANREAAQTHQQLLQAIEQATKELAQVKAQRAQEEKELASHRHQAQTERQGIERELESWRQQAKVAEPEIAAAGQLKAEVERCGFSLELMLALAAEFAQHQDARERLAGALEKHSTLIEYIAALEEAARQRQAALKSELNDLRSQLHQANIEMQGLEDSRRHLEAMVAQLQADVAGEEEMRWFYRRYRGVSGLMEFLATWDQIFFLRCNDPLSALAGVFQPSAGGTHFWTDKLATRCPHCGSTMLIWDEKPYQAVDWPVGVPLKLQLGE